jgi:hypothetical protein
MSVSSLFRAEWIKIAGNRWVTSALIWIFPVGALAFVAVMSLILALGPACVTRKDRQLGSTGRTGPSAPSKSG